LQGISDLADDAIVTMADEQMSFASVNFDRYAKTTRRATFLGEMDRILPWEQLVAIVRPHYPTGDRGRPPIDLERMLRIHFLQQWFNLSDPGVEEGIYESVSMRKFAGIDLGKKALLTKRRFASFAIYSKSTNLVNKSSQKSTAIKKERRQDFDRYDCRRFDYQRAKLHEKR